MVLMISVMIAAVIYNLTFDGGCTKAVKIVVASKVLPHLPAEQSKMEAEEKDNREDGAQSARRADAGGDEKM
ncbi:hypothetical protein Dda_3517 [Drechslerella dactyloides]|uniref:Uncharacterized protein n=1 Tax=Drechslerella dactyloides TaxID=74499 RepID=A0AAD6IYK3_DREDA|nr:hypothetical protein Dda_3517 [Drechslerella dactyloides]